MTLRVTAKPLNDLVLMEIEGATKVSVELTGHQAARLILSLGQAVLALPHDPTKPLNLQGPILQAKDASFQVGISPSGNALLAIKPEPFPSMEFEFEAEALTKLISDLRSAANVPSHQQTKPS